VVRRRGAGPVRGFFAVRVSPTASVSVRQHLQISRDSFSYQEPIHKPCVLAHPLARCCFVGM
jgi:hypothetical protein